MLFRVKDYKPCIICGYNTQYMIYGTDKRVCCQKCMDIVTGRRKKSDDFLNGDE